MPMIEKGLLDPIYKLNEGVTAARRKLELSLARTPEQKKAVLEKHLAEDQKKQAIKENSN